MAIWRLVPECAHCRLWIFIVLVGSRCFAHHSPISLPKHISRDLWGRSLDTKLCSSSLHQLPRCRQLSLLLMLSNKLFSVYRSARLLISSPYELSTLSFMWPIMMVSSTYFTIDFSWCLEVQSVSSNTICWCLYVQCESSEKCILVQKDDAVFLPV